MEELVKKKGLTKATDGIKIKVNGMKGPLEDSYEEKLDEFASSMFSEE
jgi:hypothetical protein